MVLLSVVNCFILADMTFWIPVRGYETHYEVSDDGNVRRIISPCLMHRKLTAESIDAINAFVAAGWSRNKIAKHVGVTSEVIRRFVCGVSYNYTPKNLKPAMGTDGYPFVALCKDGIRRQFTLHELVTDAFLGKRPKGLEVNHKDGNKTNPRLENLEYVTKSENTQHSLYVLLKGKKITPEIARTIRLSKGSCSRAELAARFGITVHMVTAIWIGKAWANA
jgi:transcriptional regulator with XRE-family HTH domain